MSLAVVLVAALACGTLVWSPWSGDDAPRGKTRAQKRHDRKKAAISSLRKAADQLDKAPVTRFKGRVEELDDMSAVDLRSTPSGWVRGTVSTSDDDELKLLSPSKDTYIKADKDYWKSEISDEQSKIFSDHWIKSPTGMTKLNDFPQKISPQKLAGQMRGAAGSKDVQPGAKTTVRGKRAQKLTTSDAEYYVGTASPHRLLQLRVAGEDGSDSPDSPDSPSSPDAPDGGGDGDESADPDSSSKPVAYRQVSRTTPVSDLPSGAKLDVSSPGSDKQRSFHSDFRSDLHALKDSIDTEVRFSAAEKGTLDPCTNTGCTAHLKVKNSTVADDEDRKIPVTFTVKMTLDGKRVHTCHKDKKIKPNSTTKITCHASYSASRSSGHRVYATPSAAAHAASNGEIDTMVDDFGTEWTKHDGGSEDTDGD